MAVARQDDSVTIEQDRAADDRTSNKLGVKRPTAINDENSEGLNPE
jgi:hypothetical protein